MLRYSEHALLEFSIELLLEANQLEQRCSIVVASHCVAYLLVKWAHCAILFLAGIVEDVLPQPLHEAHSLPQFVYVVAHFLMEASQGLFDLRSESEWSGAQNGPVGGVEVVARGHHAIAIRCLREL